MIYYCRVGRYRFGLTEDKKKRIVEIVNSVLKNIANKDVSTESLLYQVKELAGLVEASEDETEWIDYELEGYPRKGVSIPNYREVDFVASVPSPVGINPYDPGWKHHFSMVGHIKNTTYSILLPISRLETARESIIYTETEIHQVEKRYDDMSRFDNPTLDVQIPFESVLTTKKMDGIVASVRKRTYDFVLEYRDLAFIDSPDNMIVHNKNLLDSKIYAGLSPTEDFVLLADEINKSYMIGAYTAAGVLSRKLVENLLYSVLERAYKNIPEKKKKIYNEHEKRQEGFSILIKVFNSNYNEDFREYGGITKKSGIEQHIQILNEIKDDLDMATHNLPIIFSDKDISKIAPKLEKVSKFLRRIWDAMP